MSITLPGWLTRPTVQLCLCLFVVAFSIRLVHGLRYITFGQDQARDVVLMQRLHEQRTFIVGYGPKASVGNFYLPPLYYQVHRIASLLTGNRPLVMQWVIVTLESFTPVLLFLLIRNMVGNRASLVGALVYTVSGGVIEFATFAWNPNMIPFFSTLTVYCWYLFLFQHRQWAVPLGVVSLFVAISLHYQAIVLVPFAFLVWCIGMKRDWKSMMYWLLGAIISLILLLPYLGTEISRDWQNTRQMMTFFHESNTRFFDRVSKPAFIFTFFPALIERFVFLRNFPSYLVGRALFFIGFFVLSLSLLRQRNKQKLFILVYFLSIFIMLRVYKGDKVDYYMSTLFLLPASLFAFLAEKREKVFVVLLVVVSFFCGVRVFTRTPQNGVDLIHRASAYISAETHGKPVRLLFQDKDFINLFAYGLFSRGVIVDQTSSLVVDICNTKSVCAWDNTMTCQGPRSHTDSVIEKVASGYKKISEIEYPGAFRIVVGSEDVTSVRATHPFYPPISTAGTDTLLPQLYSDQRK